jgi:hypothetical protein
MFGSAKKKLEKLEAKYRKLLEESYQLSTVDRTKSDLKAAEADQVRQQMDALENKPK